MIGVQSDGLVCGYAMRFDKLLLHSLKGVAGLNHVFEYSVGQAAGTSFLLENDLAVFARNQFVKAFEVRFTSRSCTEKNDKSTLSVLR